MYKKNFEKFCKKENVIILVDAKKEGKKHQEIYTGIEVSIGWFLRNVDYMEKLSNGF